jgi:bifunctional ADP-heptose synthase (sugar kinase/adenylyltransferase)
VDTRLKIVEPGAAAAAARERRAAGNRIALASGFFDPLLAAHAQRLEEIAQPGRTLFVAVEDPPHPLLAARARAELIAGLRVVDYVVLAGGSSASLAGALAPDAVFTGRDADRRCTQTLIEHVHQRQTETR